MVDCLALCVCAALALCVCVCVRARACTLGTILIRSIDFRGHRTWLTLLPCVCVCVCVRVRLALSLFVQNFLYCVLSCLVCMGFVFVCVCVWRFPYVLGALSVSRSVYDVCCPSRLYVYASDRGTVYVLLSLFLLQSWLCRACMVCMYGMYDSVQ